MSSILTLQAASRATSSQRFTPYACATDIQPLYMYINAFDAFEPSTKTQRRALGGAKVGGWCSKLASTRVRVGSTIGNTTRSQSGVPSSKTLQYCACYINQPNTPHRRHLVRPFNSGILAGAFADLIQGPWFRGWRTEAFILLHLHHCDTSVVGGDLTQP